MDFVIYLYHTCTLFRSKEQLQKTGNVWECCDEFPKQPRGKAMPIFSVFLLFFDLKHTDCATI